MKETRVIKESGVNDRGVLEYLDARRRMKVESLGQGVFRVRSVPRGQIIDRPEWGLLSEEAQVAEVVSGENWTELRTKGGRCRMDGKGVLSFFREGTESPVLEEYESPPIYEHGNQTFKDLGTGMSRAICRLKARTGEQFYGLGQHHHGVWDQKGCVIDLEQKNSEITIPFLISSEGYGFLWHNPAKGRVELGKTETAWFANATRQIDYVVILGETPQAILSTYMGLTGKPSEMPDWALGFWQSTLRYENQEQALAVLEGYENRKVPVSVVVVDFFHWTKMGEWTFDPEKWPDVEGMMSRFREAGVKLAVSVWPTVNPNSAPFRKMRDAGWLIETVRGNPGLFLFSDNDANRLYLPYYDSTNESAREFLWNSLKENYYDKGVDVFWLDACEPDIKPADHDNLRFFAGAGEEVCNLYPMLHTRGVYEGQRSAGMKQPMNLVRSAWIGSQRFGATVWSGDIPSTFDGLRQQVIAGMHMGLSGIPWWTTDIGGFFGGVTGDPSFHELLIRWFQFGTFCPVMRIHGIRRRVDGQGPGDNEIWSYGESVEAVLTGYIELREKLKPYLKMVARECETEGLPFIRACFLHYPDDQAAWIVEDSFLAGRDLLVAPIMEAGARSRTVYLPGSEETWLDISGKSFSGGTSVQVDAPLHQIPIFFRSGGSISPEILSMLEDLKEPLL